MDEFVINYFEKELLKSGDKILFHTKGFSPISLGIRMLTQSFWNHVGEYVKEGSEGFVIEALPKGVAKNSIEKYIDNPSYILKAVRLKESAFKDETEYILGLRLSVKRMYDKIGKKYDTGAIVFLGIKYIFISLIRKTKKIAPNLNLFQSREKFFCSEAICESDYKISSVNPYLYQGSTKQNCSTTTPKDIGKSLFVEAITGEIHKI